MNDMDPPTSRLHSVKIQGSLNSQTVPFIARPRHCMSLRPCTGFKSYAGSVDILDLGSFTCIIGANGAGKSVMVRSPVLLL